MELMIVKKQLKKHWKLPPEIKQGAGIKDWGSIQGNLNE